MEEQGENFFLPLGANTSKCSLKINQIGTPIHWTEATRGGPEMVIVQVLFGLIFLLDFTLLAMSVDRYIAVVHAKRSPCIRSKRNAALGVGVIWLLSLLIAIPAPGPHERSSASTQRLLLWEHWADGSTAKQMYKITILLVGYLLPLVLITCCYAKVGERVVTNV